MNTVYLKTDAGRVEIEQRQADIGALARRVLILVDGRRDASALAALAGLDAASATAILIRLQALGLLVSDSVTASAGDPAVAASTIVPMVPAEQPISAVANTVEPSPESVELVKQIMSESLTRYVGLLGKPLNEQIDAVDTPDSLKKTVAKWGMALRESRHGREHAHRYLQQVNDLLGWQH